MSSDPEVKVTDTTPPEEDGGRSEMEDRSGFFLLIIQLRDGHS